MTEDFVRDQLAATYGLSETQLERLSLRLPGGWPRSSYQDLDSPPHDHPWPPSFLVQQTGLAMIFPQIGTACSRVQTALSKRPSTGGQQQPMAGEPSVIGSCLTFTPKGVSRAAWHSTLPRCCLLGTRSCPRLETEMGGSGGF